MKMKNEYNRFQFIKSRSNRKLAHSTFTMAVAARQGFMRRWGGLLFGPDKAAIVHFLQGKGLVSVQKVCPNCQNNMHMEAHATCPDGYRWRCNRPCRKTLTLRHGTIFANWHRTSISDLFFMIYLWSKKISCAKVTDIVGVKKDHVIAMFQLLREVCSNDLQRNPIRIGGGGANFVVQIDESQFHHRRRV
eukprot:TCONS_00000225-protein